MTQTATEERVRRIYRDTLDDFYGVVSRRCDGDRELAEDVVQETWLRAVRSWRADGIPERPMAWLTTVASRILANHYRKRTVERLDDGTLKVLTQIRRRVALRRFVVEGGVFRAEVADVSEGPIPEARDLIQRAARRFEGYAAPREIRI